MIEHPVFNYVENICGKFVKNKLESEHLIKPRFKHLTKLESEHLIKLEIKHLNKL